MTSKKRTVLIIDDDSENCSFLEQILQDNFRILIAQNGEEGIHLAHQNLPDLVLLGLDISGMNGLVVCECLRNDKTTRHIPIVIITASHDLDQKIRAFMTGADDFITRPFESKELLARVYSKIRRIEEREEKEDQKQDYIQCGNLKLDLKKLEVSIDSKVIPLSVLEFRLLKFFVENKEQVVNRDTILAAVWKDSIVSDRTVDTHIVSLRKKLVGLDHAITTIYGAGYILKKLEPENKKVSF